MLTGIRACTLYEWTPDWPEVRNFCIDFLKLFETNT